MGDRANIFMLERTREGTTGVYFYVHSLGYQLPVLLRRGLALGRSRWKDSAYLARIIASTLINQLGVNETTGMGISAKPLDNERPLLVVDVEEQRVGASCFPFRDLESVKDWASFEQFVAMTDEQAREFRGAAFAFMPPRPNPLPLSAIDRIIQDET